MRSNIIQEKTSTITTSCQMILKIIHSFSFHTVELGHEFVSNLQKNFCEQTDLLASFSFSCSSSPQKLDLPYTIYFYKISLILFGLRQQTSKLINYILQMYVSDLTQ